MSSTPHLPQLVQTQSNLSLFQANHAKKISEQEILKIQNRIQMLKAEQMKLAKKIDIADQKALETYHIRKEEEEQKILIVKSHSENIKPPTYPLKLKQKEILDKIKQEEKLKRYKQAQEIRFLSLKDSASVRQEIRSTYIEKKVKAKKVKQEERMSSIIVQQKLNDKRYKVRRSVNLEANSLLSEKALHDSAIKDLELQELQAIKQLQETQHKHKLTTEKLNQLRQLDTDAYLFNKSKSSSFLPKVNENE